MGLGEGNVIAGRSSSKICHEGELLALAPKVVLGYLEHAHDAVSRAVARANAEGAGGPLFFFHVEINLVGSAARLRAELDFLEKPQIVHFLLAAMELLGIIDRTFREAQLAADDVLAGPDIAGDFNLFQIVFSPFSTL